MNRDYPCRYCVMDTDVYCAHKVADADECTGVNLHNHDGYEMLLFLDGDVSMFVESHEKKLQHGDLVLIPCYTFHGITLTDNHNYERITLDIRESFLNMLSDEDTDLSMCFNRVPPGQLNVIHLNEAQIQEFIATSTALQDAVTNRGYGSRILAKAHLSKLLLMCNEYAQTVGTPHFSNLMPAIVSKTFDYVDKNLTTYLTVEKIAESLHHNSDYVSRSFRNATGTSLKHYILAKKITFTQKLLREGNSPYDVCFMSGFNNYSSFSRSFSAQTGISPKKYQLKYQNFLNANHL